MATRKAHTADALAIELWPLERLIPYEANPRHLSAAGDRQGSSFAFRVRLQAGDRGRFQGVVIVGHTRLAAARQLGLKVVPVHVAADLSPAQARAYRIADNRTNEETSWEGELLFSEIAELATANFDLALLGFDSEELAELLGKPVGLVDPDEVPELPTEPLTRPGDLWILGDNRLLCGDATRAADVERLMAGKRASLMATDPPYLVNYDGGNHPPTWANGGKRPGAAHDAGTRHWDSYVDHEAGVAFYADFLTVARECALTARPVIYSFFGMMRAPLVFAAWERAGLLLHQVLIWQKSRIVLSRSDYCWNYEPLAYGWVKGARPAAARRPPNNATAVWSVSSAILDGRQDHPTCKPVELIRRPIEYHTKAGELIYEPFCGSGTAIIAAEMTGRACRALEISPAYCDVAVRRWETFTGRQAKRASGRPE